MRFTNNNVAGISNASASTGSTAFAPMPMLSATMLQANAADQDPQRDADDEADEREYRRVVRHRCAHLTTVEADGLEDRELAAAPADGGDKRVGDRDQRERGREAREHRRQPVDVAQAIDLRGQRRPADVIGEEAALRAELRNRRDAALHLRPIGTGRIAADDVAGRAVLGDPR